MKYIFLSLISALLLSLSWPTYGIPFFIFTAFVPLLFAEHRVSSYNTIKKKSLAIFGLSFLCFFIWNLTTTGWLYNSLNPDGSKSLIAVAFPVLINSLLMSSIFQMYHWYKKRQGTYLGLIFFIVIWMSFEKLHLDWELSWPWLNLGNVFSDYHKFIQWYDILGSTGGSFWILMINIFIFYTLNTWQNFRNRKTLIRNGFFILIITFIPLLFSLYKYHSPMPEAPSEVNVILLQPGLDSYTEKYRKDSIQIVQDLLKIASKVDKKIDYFIAPETAFPGRGGLSVRGFHDSYLLKMIENFTAQYPHSAFISGISLYKTYPDQENKSKTAFLDASGSVWLDSYNSAISVIPQKEAQIYHKGKLVPGVEIFPYINILKPVLGNTLLNFGGTTSSLGTDTERRVFISPYNNARLAPIICYESIYGDFVGEYVRNGANLLTIMTNDSWWGHSQGHKQLLSYSKLRAIETRKEIIRSANNGISAHINSKGDILKTLPYNSIGSITVTARIHEGKTFYTTYGDILTRISLITFGILLLHTLTKKLFSNKKLQK